MSRRNPAQDIAPHFAGELLAHAARVDIMNRRQAYEGKLQAAQMMQELHIADDVIESLLCMTLKAEDRKP